MRQKTLHANGPAAARATRTDFEYAVANLAPRIAIDPRVPATIRVGGVGHRVVEQGARSKIAKTVERILKEIGDAAETQLARPDVASEYDGSLDLVVLSSLAEGADTIIANAGLELKYRLGTILPFAPRDYETTFDLGATHAAIDEFRRLLDAATLPGGYGVLALDGSIATHPERDAAYHDCASALIRWSDIVVAIVESGRPSQTAATVREAMELGIPVVLIDPAMPDEFAIRVGREYREPAHGDANLDYIVGLTLAPLSNFGRERSHQAQSVSTLDVYRGERLRYDANESCDFEYSGPFKAQGIVRRILRSIPGFRRSAPNRMCAKEPSVDTALWDLSFDVPMAAPVTALYLQYHRADALADAYAWRHRNAQSCVVGFGWFAVFVGAISIWARGASALELAGVELATFLVVLALIFLDNRRGWLDRWVNYRLVAEVIRYSRFLMLAGRASPFRLPPMTRGGKFDERSWTRPFLQRVLRAYGFAVPGRGALPEQDAVGNVKNLLISQCIADQIRYHCENGPAKLRSSRRLKHWIFLFAVVTSVVLLGKLVHAFGSHLPNWLAWSPHSLAGLLPNWLALSLPNIMTAAAIVLPAGASALFALRAYGEHDVVARRSVAMARELEYGRERLLDARNLTELGERMSALVGVLLWDVDGWLDIFADKHLE